MRRRIIPILLAIGCMGTSVQPAAAQEADVRAAMVESLAAWSDGDFQRLGTFFAEQTRGYMPGGSMVLTGFNPEALAAAVSAGMSFDIEPQDMDIRMLGESVAVAVATIEGVITLPGGVVQEGPWHYSETRVLEGGTWKVAQYHFSPLPEGPGKGSP